ncbi:MAG: hypothetical protein ACLFQX_09940 [Candidatus Kapaibacterium sp.]
MSKKDFKGGLDSLLGSKPGNKKKEKSGPQPTTENKSADNQPPEKETRATFIINEELLDKMKAIAYWERLRIKDVANMAFEDAVRKYEDERGEIKPIPEK